MLSEGFVYSERLGYSQGMPNKPKVPINKKLTKAQRQLIVDHYYLVRVISCQAIRKVPHFVKLQAGDFWGWATDGLIRAAQLYDKKKGVKFNTFADIRIKGAIKDGQRAITGSTVNTRANSCYLRHFRKEEDNLGRRLTKAEILARLEKMEVTLSVKAHIKRYIAMHYDGTRAIVTAGLPAPSHNEPVYLLPKLRTQSEEEILEGVNPETPEDLILTKAQSQRRAQLLKSCFKFLDRKQQIVMFGLYWREMPLAAIGQHLGVTESRVNQIKMAALEKLRRTMLVKKQRNPEALIDYYFKLLTEKRNPRVANIIKPYLRYLDDKQRQVVVNYYWEGMTHEEIGRVMGFHMATSNQIKIQALKNLKKLMLTKKHYVSQRKAYRESQPSNPSNP